MTVQPALRRLHSPDILDLASFKPADPKNVGLLLQIMVGPRDGEGEESFDALVCTPQWLLENHSSEDVISGRHHIVMFEFDIDRLKHFIEAFLSECEGSSWREVALKVGRLGRWEFEDYEGEAP